MRKILPILLFLFLTVQSAFSQDPVKWTTEVKKVSETEADIYYYANIAPKWHLYSQFTEVGGALPAAFEYESSPNFQVSGKALEMPKPTTEYDKDLEANTSFFIGKVTFVQRIKIKNNKKFNIKVYFDGQACIEGACVMVKNTFNIPVDGSLYKPGAADASDSIKDSIQNTTAITGDSAKPKAFSQIDFSSDSLAKVNAPFIKEENEMGGDKSLWWIFIAGLLGGLIALLTPCVWPMIPLTVSFFLKKSEKRSKGIRDAVIYGISIIIIYVALGLGITAIFGANALNALSTNAWFNVFFFFLLAVFAASFFGAFELTLPSSWVNKMDSRAEKTGGLLSIFFMAFTLALVSFSCTGPIIGTLLVEAVTNGFMAPLIGMFGFALALSIPFTLFAIFPKLLSKAPKSGGWMNNVKVVLGFLELAFALKFLSVADLASHWGILDREVFLVLWIVIAFMLGFYLMGKIKFKHDSDVQHVGVFKLFIAIISFGFGIYMIPGLWGAPLSAISAFSPPMYTQDFNLSGKNVEARFTDFNAGLKTAIDEKKPLMIDFTGYGCVNCREMEVAVWSDPEVAKLIEENVVLTSLYVDDKERLPDSLHYTANQGGKEVRVRTVGDRWSDLEFQLVRKQSQPIYVLLNHDGTIINQIRGYNKDVNAYKKWLKDGIDKFKKKNSK